MIKKLIKQLVKIPFIGCIVFLLVSYLRKDILRDDEKQKASEVLASYHPDVGVPFTPPLCLHLDGTAYDLQIIVPCYNVKEFICECIESILSQKTTFNVGVIIVDDGSTDGTAALVDSYSHHKNIQIIHQKNKGLAAARNAGIDQLNAPLVMFVDSDDFLYGDSILQTALSKLMSFGACSKTILEFNYVTLLYSRYFPNKRKKNKRFARPNDLYGMAWGKIYSSDLFMGVRFPEGYWFEDTLNPLVLFGHAKRIITLSEYGYCYRSRRESITHMASSNPKAIDSFYVTRKLLREANQFGINVTSASFANTLMRQAVFICSCVKNLPLLIRRAVFAELASCLAIYKMPSTVGCTYKSLSHALKRNDFGSYETICKLL